MHAPTLYNTHRVLMVSIARLWLPLVAVLAAVLWLLYQAQLRTTLTVARSNERQSILLARQTITAELGLLRNDALYLADYEPLQRWLDTGRAAPRERLSNDFITFVKYHDQYDQVRFLDAQGQEVVRVNWNNGKPGVVPLEALQNKSGRYYVEKTLSQVKGAVYISPFDLNVEHNDIEQPLKPMIRLSTPVVDSKGRARGLIVLNYLGNRLIDQLRAIPDAGRQKIWLLNARGYWLLGPKPELEWGFMYPDRQDRRFDVDFPDIWAKIRNQPGSGQWLQNNGLFTYADVSPAGWASEADPGSWLLVTHVPTAILASRTADEARNLIVAFVVLALLLGLLSGLVAHHRERRRQGEVRYRELLNNLPVGVYRDTPDAGGQFLEVNPAMASIFGAASTAELSKYPVNNLYCNPTDRGLLAGKLLERGSVSGEQLRLKTLKGREFDAAITAVKKTDASGRIYFDGIVEDISMRKENEHRIYQLNANLRTRSRELETINRELETFSYSVSHDLRAPLRAIDGFSSTLLSDNLEQLSDKGKDCLNRIRAAAQRMAELIDDLIDLSRISRADLKRDAVDLTQIAAEIMAALRQAEPERRVQSSIAPGATAQGDAGMLKIVIDNLLGNAWKFTSQTDTAIIEVGTQTEDGELIYFVRDNGAGFDMTYADKLFGAFQRLHDVREFPGTGIGLATVQRIINKHGGRIWAESTIGQGACFYFVLETKEPSWTRKRSY